MSPVQRIGNPEFLRRARSLLINGKPKQAIEKLYTFSYDSSKQAVLPQEYYRLQAIAALVLGETSTAEGYLRDAGEFSLKEFRDYEAAFLAYFSRPVPHWKRSRERREQQLKTNLRQLIKLSQEVNVDPLDRLPHWLTSSAS